MTTVKQSTAILSDLEMKDFRELITPILIKTGQPNLLKACFMIAPWSDSGFLDIFMTNLKSVKEEDNWFTAVEFLVPSLYYIYLEQSIDPYTGKKKDPRNNERFYKKFWKLVNVRNSKVLMTLPFFRRLFPNEEEVDVEDPPPKKVPAKTQPTVDLIERAFKEDIPAPMSDKLRQYKITAQLLCDSTIEDLRFSLQGTSSPSGRNSPY